MTKKIQNLRNKIAARTAELNIRPDHDNTGHYYLMGDQRYPSVTKKLGLIKDEGLMNWKMNRALEYMENDLSTNHKEEYVSEINILELIQQAKLAPQLEFEGAGDIGSTTHGWREEWFQRWITENWIIPEIPYPTQDPRPEVKAGCEGIKRAIADLKAQPLACELRLADAILQLGGSLDDIWAVPVDSKIPDNSLGEGGFKIKRKWEIWLVDLKTSNIGNKNSYYMQVATYWHMFTKLYKIKIDKLFILHTSKTRFGEYELIPLKHPKRYWQMAKNVYRLYDDMQELEQLKKPEIARI